MSSLKFSMRVFICMAIFLLLTDGLPMDFGDTKAGLLEICKGFEHARINKVLCLLCKGFDVSCFVRSTTTTSTTTTSTTPTTTTTTTTTPAPE